MLKTLKLFQRGEMKKKLLTLRNEKLLMDRIKLLGEHVLTRVKIKNGTTAGKEGEREGQRKNWGREVLALPVKIPAPDLNPTSYPSEGGHTVHAIFTSIPKWS